MKKADSTILLVSNDSTDMLIKYALEQAFSNHVYVVIINSDIEAIYYLQSTVTKTLVLTYSLPRVIVTDLNTPVLSDLKLLTWVRQHLSFIDIPIIVMRNSQDKDQVLQAMNLGASSYFIKSKSINNLVCLVKAFLP